jgi:hypothetical protein
MSNSELSAQGRTPMTDTGVELVKAAPPAVVAAFHMFGHSLPEWVSLLTVIYLCGLIAQQGHKLYRWWRYPWLRGK